MVLQSIWTKNTLYNIVLSQFTIKSTFIYPYNAPWAPQRSAVPHPRSRRGTPRFWHPSPSRVENNTDAISIKTRTPNKWLLYKHPKSRLSYQTKNSRNHVDSWKVSYFEWHKSQVAIFNYNISVKVKQPSLKDTNRSVSFPEWLMPVPNILSVFHLP